MPAFDLQGHRGARGLRPENTLPSFEAALDAGVSSVETDLHLTADGAVVLCHDPVLDPAIFGPTAPAGARVRSLRLAELRAFAAAGNPDPARFPGQDARHTPLAAAFAAERGLAPHAVPTLGDLFDFAAAYAGEEGRRAGKGDGRRARAARLRFDLELKRVPFHPETVDDGFTGAGPGPFEAAVAAAVQTAGVADRVAVRSFDHRSVRALTGPGAGLTGGVLVADTAVVSPADVAHAAGAAVYCPDYRFLDEGLVRAAHAGGVRVLPWTVNDLDDCRRLLAWGIDGVTTDYPDRVAGLLREMGVEW
jgi:glycerophosphoryl diester phosphodiesterase